MMIFSSLRELREWVDAKIANRLASIVWYAPVAKSSADGSSDAVEGHQIDVDEPPDGVARDYQVPARRVEPFGLRSVPPTGVFGAVIRAMGGAANGILVGISSNRYGPSALVAGEVELYCKATGTSIKLDENGKITIDAASGQDIVINGGSAKVARVGDATAGHTHAFGTLMCPNTGTGISVAITGATASQTDTIAQGADRFKA